MFRSNRETPYNADNPEQANESFDYDGVGNRLTAADTAGEWSYNANNELEGYDDVTFNYDANGNMIEKSAGGVITRFFYNLEDRLERVEDASGHVIASYYYDPFGRRLWKEVAGTRTCFHYSDEGLIGEYDASGVEIKTYGWKPGSTWSTDPVFMKVGGVYYWYHNDHLGTPQMMTTSSGAVVWSAKYSSFGKADVNPASTVTNNLRFPGQYEDVETGLHYNWHRYFEGETNRYTKKDPVSLSRLKLIIQITENKLNDTFPNYPIDNLKLNLFSHLLFDFFLKNPEQNNLYPYTFNDPINWLDPEGLFYHRPGVKFIIGKAIRGWVNSFVSDPAAQRIITSGISGAITGLGAGIIGGAIAGAAATGPLAGIGAIPGAIIGGISGFSTGLSTGLLYGVIFEMTGIPGRLEKPCPDS